MPILIIDRPQDSLQILRKNLVCPTRKLHSKISLWNLKRNRRNNQSTTTYTLIGKWNQLASTNLSRLVVGCGLSHFLGERSGMLEMRQSSSRTVSFFGRRPNSFRINFRSSNRRFSIVKAQILSLQSMGSWIYLRTTLRSYILATRIRNAGQGLRRSVGLREEASGFVVSGFHHGDPEKCRLSLFVVRLVKDSEACVDSVYSSLDWSRTPKCVSTRFIHH